MPNHCPSRPLRSVLAISVIGFAVTSNASPAKALQLGVHPYLPATVLMERFAPLTQYLSQHLHREVRAYVAQDYAAHIQNIGKDRVDLAYLGPAPYVRMVETYGAKPMLARLEIRGRTSYRGVIVVRAESPMRTLPELRGKSFAFGDPHSTMSSLVPQYMLRTAGVPLKELESHFFIRNHRNAALGVLAGDFDAGAMKEEVFQSYAARGLRALAWTPEITSHLFVASSALSEDLVNRLRDALVQLDCLAIGPGILNALRASTTACPSR